MSKFRVCFSPALEVLSEEFISDTVSSFESAKMIMDAVANYTLLLHRSKLMLDFSNMAEIQQEVDGEWLECTDFEEEQQELFDSANDALNSLSVKRYDTSAFDY
jgi:hypothetical protein